MAAFQGLPPLAINGSPLRGIYRGFISSRSADIMSAAMDHSGRHVAHLRPARLGDLEAILRIEHACFARDRLHFNRRQVRYLIGARSGVALVAEVGGNVVGWSVGLVRHHARGRSARSGRIYTLAVDPGARGGGVGRLLLARTIRALRRRGAGRIFLEVQAENDPAISLYRAVGFVEQHVLPHYYGRRRHGLHMVLGSDEC